MSALPAELVDQVIDELQEDRNTLRSCSLVCKSWLPRTSAYMFKSLKVRCLVGTYKQPDLWKAPFNQFCALMATSTRMLAHVQSLDIGMRPSTVAEVATIAAKLHRLRSLTIYDMEFDAAPPTEVLSCSGRHIERLCILDARVDVIAYFLGLFASVGTLEVLYRGSDDEDVLHTYPERKHQVQHLRTLHIAGLALRYVAALTEPSALERITASLREPWETEDLGQALGITGAHIRHLDVAFGRAPWNPAADLSALQVCTHLEVFAITVPWRMCHGPWWRGLPPYLSALPGRTRVARIVVLDYWGSDVRDVLCDVDWSMVGNALEHCQDLEALQVTVDSDVSPISASEYHDLREAIVAQLPSRLRSRIVFE